jgi:murein DD-endopeptidase MepM/ murein hydrolase activator NlpD
MKKTLFTFLTLFSFFLLSIINSKSVYASTEAYKITDGFHAKDTISGDIYLISTIGFTYRGGDVYLSKNPDGTGNANIGDWVQISKLDGSPDYDYKAAGPGCSYIKPMPPTNITSFFNAKRSYSLLARLLKLCNIGERDFSSLYLVVKNIPDPTPTVTPTLLPTNTPFPTARPTATPTPSGPIPFLDLPWDYKSKGLTFNQAALSINSFFDHTYPLLSVGIAEPSQYLNQVTTFEGENSIDKNYSSHDGYDYGHPAKITYGDSVLAAADGTATYVNNCAACGNMILIDHHNGYQTRYMHLQKDGLIVTDPNKKIDVKGGQKIGKVGATGNVIPPNNTGAHIHFEVVEDKNHDGNFNDNVPDGASDPFGWQSKNSDPWKTYQFQYGGNVHSGNTSYYLWKEKIDSLRSKIDQNGGVFKVANFALIFADNAVKTEAELELHMSPALKWDNLSSIGTSIVAIMKDGFGQFIKQFDQTFTISIDFNGQDLSSYKPYTFFIFSS